MGLGVLMLGIGRGEVIVQLFTVKVRNATEEAQRMYLHVDWGGLWE